MRSVDSLRKKHNRLVEVVGSVDNLSTTDVSSIVAALNEIHAGLVSLGWVPPEPPPPPPSPDGDSGSDPNFVFGNESYNPDGNIVF